MTETPWSDKDRRSLTSIPCQQPHLSHKRTTNPKGSKKFAIGRETKGKETNYNMKLQATILAFLAATTTNVLAQPMEANVEAVEYSDPYDGDFPLKGYVSVPGDLPAPAVVIVVCLHVVGDFDPMNMAFRLSPTFRF